MPCSAVGGVSIWLTAVTPTHRTARAHGEQNAIRSVEQGKWHFKASSPAEGNAHTHLRVCPQTHTCPQPLTFVHLSSITPASNLAMWVLLLAPLTMEVSKTPKMVSRTQEHWGESRPVPFGAVATCQVWPVHTELSSRCKRHTGFQGL